MRLPLFPVGCGGEYRLLLSVREYKIQSVALYRLPEIAYFPKAVKEAPDALLKARWLNATGPGAGREQAGRPGSARPLWGRCVRGGQPPLGAPPEGPGWG